QVGTPEEIVSNPANDYVRSFFYGVDVSQVYTAGDIANRKQVTVIERPGMNINAALERMRQHDRDVAVVIDRNRTYQGTVSMDSLNAQFDHGGEPKYADAFLEEVEPIPDDTPMQEVVGKVAGSRWPLPVVDADGKYLGSISKTSILRTLDRTG
ncbi:CBS domain-containing protein, partial [Arhodomonas aquaeolei]|uniref:CBS domain-containing protein n=1 Tax=Arhodomonas aquaeolei TaxID=2369 RepID=UPI002168C7E3